jgi:hypothetical protein
LQLKREGLTGEPHTTLQANHLVLTHELWQQCFQGIAIPITLQSHALSNHLDMAVIVMVVVMVMVVVVVMLVVVVVVVGQGSGMMFKPQHHS